jgi:hypothetical protein
LAALVSETATRFAMPRVARSFQDSGAVWAVFWGTVVAASVLVLVVGMWVLKHRLPDAIANTPEAMRRERRRLAEMDEVAASGSAS